MSKKIEPEEYSKNLELISLRQIVFAEIKSKTFPENIIKKGSISVNIANNVQMQIAQERKGFIGNDKYTIEGLVENKKIFEIVIHIVAIYDSETPINQEFVEAFGKLSLKLFTYPYARQLVQDLTAKMGFPPLVLPLWKQIGRKPSNIEINEAINSE